MGTMQDGQDLWLIEIRRVDCEKCTFWNGLSSIHGECRRYPPIPTEETMEDNKTRRSIFPITSHRHWCGEFIDTDRIYPPPPEEKNQKQL